MLYEKDTYEALLPLPFERVSEPEASPLQLRKAPMENVFPVGGKAMRRQIDVVHLT
jgi:hypothetical protein